MCLDDVLRDFAVEQLSSLYDGSQPARPRTVYLDEYPAEMIAAALDNATSHPLITMSHLDRSGYPFISVMGFSFLDGKIHIAARANALKLRRLENDPRCCMLYHNNVPRPARLACLTMLGRARVTDDPATVRRANEALCLKNYHDEDPDVERRAPMIEAMQRAERRVIIFDEVEAIYLMTPMLPSTGSGIPNPVVAWRGDHR
jgi:hypothetical protein